MSVYLWNTHVDCINERLTLDVDMLNAIKNVMADIFSVSPSSEQ